MLNTPNDDHEINDPVTTLQQLVARRIRTETAIEWAKESNSEVQSMHLHRELQDLDTAILAIRATYQIK